MRGPSTPLEGINKVLLELEGLFTGDPKDRLVRQVRCSPHRDAWNTWRIRQVYQ